MTVCPESRMRIFGREARFTFQDGELGTGVDLPHAVGGRALIDSLVPVGPEGLDPQHRARAIVELNHLLQDPDQDIRTLRLTRSERRRSQARSQRHGPVKKHVWTCPLSRPLRCEYEIRGDLNVGDFLVSGGTLTCDFPKIKDPGSFDHNAHILAEVCVGSMLI